jgi:hypothetical protein
MLRLLTRVLLLPPLLLPPGVCLCHCGPIAGAAADDEHDHLAQDACGSNTPGHHCPEHLPCNNPAHHAPGCPALKAPTHFSPREQCNPFLWLTVAGQTPCRDATAFAARNTAAWPQRAAAGERLPLFLILLTLRI